MAPDIEWLKDEREALRLSGLRGLPVLVDFFKEG